MNSLIKCPKNLPDELVALVANFGRIWAASPVRPRPAFHVLEHWSSLLDDWERNRELPLFVRKSSSSRGSAVIHQTRREIVYCDNSPAHWAYMMASKGECPTIGDVETLIRNNKIPAVMIQRSVEKTNKYGCCLPKESNVNVHGWKLAHIRPVGMKTRKPISEIPIEKIAEAFKNLLSPSNMFVVPLAWGGIAEAQAVIDAIAIADQVN